MFTRKILTCLVGLLLITEVCTQAIAAPQAAATAPAATQREPLAATTRAAQTQEASDQWVVAMVQGWGGTFRRDPKRPGTTAALPRVEILPARPGAATSGPAGQSETSDND
jgi:hypothetical protein